MAAALDPVLNDSDLYTQMTALAEVEYLTLTKSGRGPGASTTDVITGQGRQAYGHHRAALQLLLDPQPCPAVP